MFKITILGHVKSGKRTIFKNINSPYITIENSRAMLGADFYQMLYWRHNIQNNVSLICVNGNPRYRFLYPQLIRAAKAVIVVFDVTNRDSYDSIKYWISLARSNQIERPYGFLVGNKIDSDQRTISFEEGFKAAQQEGFIYIEISALSKEDVRNLFQNVIIFVENHFLL